MCQIRALEKEWILLLIEAEVCHIRPSKKDFEQSALTDLCENTPSEEKDFENCSLTDFCRIRASKKG